MDKEEYKRELIRMWDSVRGDNLKGGKDCNGIKCEDCQFDSIPLCNKGISAFEMIEAVEKWSKEHPQKHKVSKLEYDILDAYTNLFDFGDVKMLNFSLFDRLHEIGYFKGVTKDMYIKDYFNNCEVDRRK